MYIYACLYAIKVLFVGPRNRHWVEFAKRRINNRTIRHDAKGAVRIVYCLGKMHLWGSNTTVTLPKPTAGRRSTRKIVENRALSADCRPTLTPIIADFLVGRRLFCRSTQVKSFVDRSADFFIGFVIGEASGDDRPMIERQSADVLKNFSSWYRPKVAWSSGVNWPTIARRTVDAILSKSHRQTDDGYRLSFGRWSPDARLTANYEKG